MNRDEVMRETIEHVHSVASNMMLVIQSLQKRAIEHDRSKFSPEEFETFANETDNLKQMTYGSPEYKQSLKRLGPALDHHYKNNSHHPEHHKDGIYGMDLLDLIELLADWKAATSRMDNGNLATSIIENSKRHKYDKRMATLLGTTALKLGWISSEDYARIVNVEKEENAKSWLL